MSHYIYHAVSCVPYYITMCHVSHIISQCVMCVILYHPVSCMSYCVTLSRLLIFNTMPTVSCWTQGSPEVILFRGAKIEPPINDSAGLVELMDGCQVHNLIFCQPWTCWGCGYRSHVTKCNDIM